MTQAFAGLHNPISADGNGDPNDAFFTTDALFMYATSDIKGGTACIVSASMQVPAGDCAGAKAWGSPNRIVGIGTVYELLQGPSLRVGSWKIMTEDSFHVATNLSDIFTVSPCDIGMGCDSELGQEQADAFKASVAPMADGSTITCLGFELKDAADDPAGAAAKQNLIPPGTEGGSLSGGGFSVSFSPVGGLSFGFPGFDNPGEAKALEILKELTCNLRQMYKDILADPPDANFGSVLQPAYTTVPTLGDSVTDSLVTTLDRQRAYARVLLKAYERYQGAVVAHDIAGQIRQAEAMTQFGDLLQDELASSAATLETYATHISGGSGYVHPVLADEAIRTRATEIYTRIRNNGFSPSELTSLAAGGVDTPAEIAIARTAFDLDPSTYPIGETLQTRVRTYATQMREEMPAIDTFANNTAAVASQLLANQGGTTPNSPPSVIALQATTAEATAVNVSLQGSDPDNDPLQFATSQPSHGTVQLAGATAAYTPAAGFAGTDSFTYTASDGQATSGAATVTITVTSNGTSNHAPTAQAVSATTTQATPVTIALDGSDPDGDPIVFTVTVQPSHGAAETQGGYVLYTPATSYSGVDTFSYTASDGTLTSSAAVATITISPNRPPVAVNDTLLAYTGQPLDSAVLANDSDPDGNVLAIGSFTQPAHGTVDCPVNCIYRSDDGYVGLDSYTYSAVDPAGASSTATVTVRVGLDPNLLVTAATSPTGTDLNVTLGNQATLNVTVRNNGTAIAPDSFVTITLSPSVTLVSATSEAGSCSGTTTVECSVGNVRVSDQIAITLVVVPHAAGPQTNLLSVTTTGVDADPSDNAYSDRFTVFSDAPSIHKYTTVRDTDMASAGAGGMRGLGTGEIALAGVSGPVTKALLYWHGPAESTDPSANSTVSFAGTSVTGTNIGLSSDNCWGYANSQAYRADVTSLVSGNGTYALADFNKPDTSTEINGASLIAFFNDGNTVNNRDVVLFDGNDSNIHNYYDADGWNVTLGGILYAGGDASIEMHVSDGQAYDDDAVSINGDVLVASGPTFDGNTVPGPDNGYSGRLWDIKSFDVTSFLTNGLNSLSLTTGQNADCLSLVVAAVDLPAGAAPVDNRPPTATALSVTTPLGAAVPVTLTGSDPDANPLTFAVATGPTHGTLSGTAPNLTYTPAAGYSGPDSFTYKANDGLLDSPAATVSITVTKVNHAPAAAAKTVSTPQDTAAPVTLTGTDIDGDVLSFAVIASPTHGLLSGTAPNLTYTPAAGYSGPDSFTYKANDGLLDSPAATVSITVIPRVVVNHAPTANAMTVTTSQDLAVRVTLAGTDPDHDPLTFTVATQPAHGTLSGSAPNLTYTPRYGYSGPDSFTYKANDGTLSSPAATVSITVTKATSCTITTPRLDAVVSSDQKTGVKKMVSGALNTSSTGELILAFIGTDGPGSPTQKITSVTGGGLTWSLVARANETYGTTEVWQARASNRLRGLKVTATLNNGGYDGSITLAAFTGAGKIAATAAAYGTTGASSVAIAPTQANSLIWAGGHDWTAVRNVMPVPGQTMRHMFRDARVQDTFWTQSRDAATTGTSRVTIADTGFTNDRWTMVAVEIPGVCAVDCQPSSPRAS
jgi:uncharacterized repeat protein (TIGR01451 family)